MWSRNAIVEPMSIVQNQKFLRSASVGDRSVSRHDVRPLAEWSSTAFIDDEVKISMPLAVIATQHPRVSGPHDEVLPDKEQDAAFARKSKALAGMMEELGRYLQKGDK